MKWMSIFVGIVALLVDSDASGQVTRRRVLVPPPVGGGGVAVGESTNAAVTIAMAGGQTLTVTENPTHTIFSDSAGKEVYSLAKPLGMRGFRGRVVSPSGTAAAFIVDRTNGGARSHDHVLIAHIADGVFTFREVLEKGKDHLPGKDISFSQMGAVSDDGKAILAQVGVSPKGIGSVEYQWQTWEVAPVPRLLGVGLTIANGVVQDKKGK